MNSQQEYYKAYKKYKSKYKRALYGGATQLVVNDYPIENCKEGERDGKPVYKNPDDYSKDSPCIELVRRHREQVRAEREQLNSKLSIGSQVFKELNDDGEFYEDYLSDSKNKETITPEHRKAYLYYIKNAMTTVEKTPEGLRVEMPIEINSPLIREPVDNTILKRGKAVHDKDTLDTISELEMDDYIYYINKRLWDMQQSMLALRGEISDYASQLCIPCTVDRERDGHFECQQHNREWRATQTGDSDRNIGCQDIRISE